MRQPLQCIDVRLVVALFQCPSIASLLTSGNSSTYYSCDGWPKLKRRNKEITKMPWKRDEIVDQRCIHA